MTVIRQLKQYDNQQSWAEYNIGSVDTYVSLNSPGYYITSATSAAPTEQGWLENVNIEDQVHDVESLLKNVNTRLTQIETVTIPSLVTISVFQNSTANLTNAINNLSNSINTLKKMPIKLKQKYFTNIYVKAGDYGAINGSSAATATRLYKNKGCTNLVTALKIVDPDGDKILGISSIQLPKGSSATTATAWGESCIVRQNLNLITSSGMPSSTAYVTVAIKNYASKVSCNDLYINYFATP